MSRKIYLIFLVLILGAGAFLVFNRNRPSLNGVCSAYQNSIVMFGEAEISVEIANDDCKRELGLSGRDSLASGNGMLFIYEEEGAHGMWMKDMEFPIDAVWIDTNLEITGIEKNMRPASFPHSFGGEFVSRYVVELPAGFLDGNGITDESKVVMFVP